MYSEYRKIPDHSGLFRALLEQRLGGKTKSLGNILQYSVVLGLKVLQALLKLFEYMTKRTLVQKNGILVGKIFVERCHKLYLKYFHLFPLI